MYWITGLLGLALIAAPWVFGYSNDTTALWTSIVLGAIVALVSAYKVIVRDTKQYWEYWVAGLAGAAAIIAPFLLGFSELTAALWASIIVGALLLIVAAYEVFFVQPEAA